MSAYRDEYTRSISDPNGFWLEQAQALGWYRHPSTGFTPGDDGSGTWFADGELNTAYLAVDHHVDEGRGDEIALIYDSPVTNQVRRFSYRKLQTEIALLAGAIQRLGVTVGDRVIVYMPMIPEAVFAMLACARIGAVHSVVFGGFAARELAVRIDDAEPVLVLGASCGIEFANVIPYKPLLDEARRIARFQPSATLILQRPECVAAMGDGDLDWQTEVQRSTPVGCVSVRGSDPLYILYTSGTTGKPKGVVRDNGGHAVALAYSMRAIYGVGPGDVFWAASDVGWVVGHSYIVYAPLIAGCTTILFEGKPVRTPDAGTFWRVIDDYKVKVFFTAPTAFRAIRKEDPECLELAKYDIGSLTAQFVAGERTDPATYEWLCEHLQVPVIDHWWQTETGWTIAGNPLGIELHDRKPGSVSLPAPGFDVQILAPDGSVCGTGEEGDVVVRLPLPPGCLPTIWGDHSRFVDGYLTTHPGYYHTGDGGFIDEDGYLFVMGRTDDVINVAGHRLSTGEMEEIVASHADVAECAVIGIEHPEKGQVPAGLVVLKDGVNTNDTELTAALVAMVRKNIGPIANFKQAAIVARLPKTRSGKILRKVMRNIADGKPFELPATIDDPVILDEIEAVLRTRGIGLIAG